MSRTEEAAAATGAGHERAADRLLLGALRHSAGRSAAICLLSTAAAGAGLALPAVLGRTLDVLLAEGKGGGPGAGPWILACAGLTLLVVLLGSLDVLLTGTTNARGTAWLRGLTLRHVLAVGPRAAGGGDLVTRLVGNAAHAGTAPAALAGTLAAVATPVGGLVALALIDLWLAAAFLVGMPLFALLLRTFVRQSSDSVARYQRAQGDIAGRLVEALGGARTIAAAGTAGRETRRVLGPLPELSRQGHRMWQVQGRSSAQAAAVVPLLQIAVLAVAGLRVSGGDMSVGGLLAASRYAALATGVGTLVGHLNGLVRSRMAARRLAEVLAAPAMPHGDRHLPDGGGPAPGGPLCGSARPGTLELSGVTAARGARTFLDGVDLLVPGGSSMAVVGRSGAGKSLLAAVAGRLAEPDGGVVVLDGVPLPELGHDALRRAIGYAFERPVLLGATIGDTIALGVDAPGAERITEAARAACADDFIRLLPDGYATACDDAPLSGGEVQRLGLARAFAHQGRLLILDDATSSLDTVTEHRVSQALLHGPGAGRTRLIIAHRASTAARADRVAWLEEGRIRRVGRHAELWEDPDYRAVFGDGPDEHEHEHEAGAEDVSGKADGRADG